MLALLRGYQWLLSPWLGNQCRFWPTCSEYARQAIDSHGASRGAVLALARILRCQPWATGGIDPVPKTFSWHTTCGCRDAAARFYPGPGRGVQRADNRGAQASHVDPHLDQSRDQHGNRLDHVRDAGSHPGHR